MALPAEKVARRHYEARQLLAARATAAAVQAWSALDTDDIAASWANEVPHMTAVVTKAQLLAASAADDYIDEALAAQRITRAAEGTVLPEALAGVASDGRAIETLLAQPAITTLSRIATGFELVHALGSGRSALTMIVATQVSDAGRVADGIAVTTRPGTAYVRMLNTPSCARCAVLAGRVYKWNTGFQRHPRCDCRHVPVAENTKGHVTTDTDAYFRSLVKADQDRIFTSAGAQSIREGADIGQVVNARRGMYQANGTTFTREGVTRFGSAGKQLRGRQRRLMPESIYEIADGDRDLAISLLREHGYIA